MLELDTKYGLHEVFLNYFIPDNSKTGIFQSNVIHLSFCFEETLYKTFHRCFIPNLGSFGQAVSEEKIFLEIDQSETRIACGGHVC
jgi:hypothetical protein